jgi:hypothetical protein
MAHLHKAELVVAVHVALVVNKTRNVRIMKHSGIFM